LVEHFLQGLTQQELASRLKISQATVSRQIDAGLGEVRTRLRARGVICGAGLASLMGHNSAQAAPVSLQASLGKMAISGVGSSSGTPLLAAAFVNMNITKATLTVAAAAALIAPPLLFLRKGDTFSSKPKASASVKVPGAPAAKTPERRNVRPAAIVRHEPSPVPESVRLKVDAILSRHQGLSKAEVLRTEEMQRIIDLFFNKVDLGGPDMQRRAERSREALYDAKGQPPGTGAFVFHTGEPDSPEFREWLEAAVSDDPQRAQDWILRRLEGAAFEFSLDPSRERSTDGVSLRPPPAPPDDEK
jgi:hypothetical protein